jgi:hypothetical protein
MSTAAAGIVDIRLSCHPGKEGKVLVFRYKVQNHGTADAYVMDAVTGVDAASGGVRPNPQSVVVLHGPGEDATVGKFIAPLPTDRRIAMPVVPLARRLVPGATLESRLEIPLPFAEASPYFADLPLRQYDIVDIKGVVLSIGYWIAGADGLAALAVEYASELYNIVTRDTVRSARRVSQRFPTRSLQLFRRTDQFPRAIPGEPAPAASEGEVLASRAGPPPG